MQVRLIKFTLLAACCFFSQNSIADSDVDFEITYVAQNIGYGTAIFPFMFMSSCSSSKFGSNQAKPGPSDVTLDCQSYFGHGFGFRVLKKFSQSYFLSSQLIYTEGYVGGDPDANLKAAFVELGVGQQALWGTRIGIDGGLSSIVRKSDSVFSGENYSNFGLYIEKPIKLHNDSGLIIKLHFLKTKLDDFYRNTTPVSGWAFEIGTFF